MLYHFPVKKAFESFFYFDNKSAFPTPLKKKNRIEKKEIVLIIFYNKWNMTKKDTGQRLFAKRSNLRACHIMGRGYTY